MSPLPFPLRPPQTLLPGWDDRKGLSPVCATVRDTGREKDRDGRRMLGSSSSDGVCLKGKFQVMATAGVKWEIRGDKEIAQPC